MREKLEYETPRASVRGVFLCENVAGTETSVLITGAGAIQQDEWGSSVEFHSTYEYLDFDY
jgi:hypothetical protein